MKQVLAIVLALGLVACGQNYSDGTRVGVVTKLSSKGLMMKSWEGELNMGGLREVQGERGSSMVANVFEFNADPSVVPQLQAAMESGKRVELTYRQWAIPPVSIDNSHVIVHVRVL